MAFRKRNVALGSGGTDKVLSNDSTKDISQGTRPSSLTSHPVTSTGTSSLDSVLGGHGGLVLGSSLLVEENGTTDFAGALLRYYAAQGISHNHIIHVMAVGDGWVRELPGLAEVRSSRKTKNASQDYDKMKIAWRYENLGQAGERVLPNRSLASHADPTELDTAFCHTFDLTKRLDIPPDAKINHMQPSSGSAPFDSAMRELERSLQSSSQSSIHRLVVPSILSPALYPPQANRPENFIRFLQSLRSLLRQYSNRLTAMITLPLELHSRSSGLVRWAEIISDGVIELTPFPHLMTAVGILAEGGGASSHEEQPQGMLKIHKLPVNTERGEGGAGAGNTIGDDLTFTISRRKFIIKLYSLPPLEGDPEAQSEAGKFTAKDVEF